MPPAQIGPASPPPPLFLYPHPLRLSPSPDGESATEIKTLHPRTGESTTPIRPVTVSRCRVRAGGQLRNVSAPSRGCFLARSKQDRRNNKHYHIETRHQSPRHPFEISYGLLQCNEECLGMFTEELRQKDPIIDEIIENQQNKRHCQQTHCRAKSSIYGLSAIVHDPP